MKECDGFVIQRFSPSLPNPIVLNCNSCIIQNIEDRTTFAGRCFMKQGCKTRYQMSSLKEK